MYFHLVLDMKSHAMDIFKNYMCVPPAMFDKLMQRFSLRITGPGTNY